jgi:hypothetical protein
VVPTVAEPRLFLDYCNSETPPEIASLIAPRSCVLGSRKPGQTASAPNGWRKRFSGFGARTEPTGPKRRCGWTALKVATAGNGEVAESIMEKV